MLKFDGNKVLNSPRRRAAACSIVVIYLIAATVSIFGDTLGIADLLQKDPTLNREILAAAKTYNEPRRFKVASAQETYDNYGVTRDIEYQGSVIAKKPIEDKIYCIGFIFDTYMKACEIAKGRNFVLPKVSSTNFPDFRKDFYGVDGNKKTFVEALSKRGLGREITNLEEARKGDLVQLWRRNSGHAVVFIEWIRRDEQIAGIRYWSVQSKTGIGIAFEGVGEKKNIKPENIFIVRAFEPK